MVVLVNPLRCVYTGKCGPAGEGRGCTCCMPQYRPVGHLGPGAEWPSFSMILAPPLHSRSSG